MLLTVNYSWGPQLVVHIFQNVDRIGVKTLLCWLIVCVQVYVCKCMTNAWWDVEKQQLFSGSKMMDLFLGLASWISWNTLYHCACIGPKTVLINLATCIKARWMSCCLLRNTSDTHTTPPYSPLFFFFTFLLVHKINKRDATCYLVSFRDFGWCTFFFISEQSQASCFPLLPALLLSQGSPSLYLMHRHEMYILPFMSVSERNVSQMFPKCLRLIRFQ